MIDLSSSTAHRHKILARSKIDAGDCEQYIA
jgi:hypothetical protein